MLKLYQVEWCPHCHRVRQLLTELGLTYMAVNVAEDPTKRTELIALSGQSAVPVLVDGEQVISGSEEIVKHLTETYPAAGDAAQHAAHGAWRIAMVSPLEPAAALSRLIELLTEAGFRLLSRTQGPQIDDRLPDSYVLLSAAVPVAAHKAIDLDPSAVSAVAVPLAVMAHAEGAAILAADPVGQVWLFASPELHKVQAMVRKRLADVFGKL